MKKSRVPRDLLEPVVDYFRPQRVILFGSWARGEAARDSDIDLLVIVDDDTPPEKLHWQDGFGAYRSKRDADIFPMRAEDFERNRAIVNTLAAEADTDGIVVYGSPKGSCMKGADPRARWEAVKRWLEVAVVDRNAAQALLVVPSLRPIGSRGRQEFSRNRGAGGCCQELERLGLHLSLPVRQSATRAGRERIAAGARCHRQTGVAADGGQSRAARLIAEPLV